MARGWLTSVLDYDAGKQGGGVTDWIYQRWQTNIKLSGAVDEREGRGEIGGVGGWGWGWGVRRAKFVCIVYAVSLEKASIRMIAPS